MYHTICSWTLAFIRHSYTTKTIILEISNSILYNNHVYGTNRCELFGKIKTSEHYFFPCNRSADQRVDLSPATRTVHPIIINAHFLLDNNSQLSSELNVMIVDAMPYTNT